MPELAPNELSHAEDGGPKDWDEIKEFPLDRQRRLAKEAEEARNAKVAPVGLLAKMNPDLVAKRKVAELEKIAKVKEYFKKAA